MSNFLKDNMVMNEYNYQKNIDIDLEKITIGSSKKIWWKCNKCGNEWLATPRNRIKGGTGCPVCSLNKIGINHNKAILNKRGSLFDNRPDLVKEWDIEKNLPLTPKDVTTGSGKLVWWKCEKGHEWQARVCNRTSGSGCIYCAGQKSIKGENDLVTTHPELLNSWDFEKNKDLDPSDFMAGSNRKVWWKCPLGHSWKASVSKRTDGTGCPHCYFEYGTSFPEQAILFYLSKVTKVESRKKIDGQEIDIYLPEFKAGFEYDGSYYHENEKSKLKEKEKNKIVNDNNIMLYHIKESNKNEINKDNKTIYCIIDRDYNYLEQVIKYIEELLNLTVSKVDIQKDQISIYNQYIKSIKDNNFTVTHPELLEEWDYEKNKGLLPESLSIGSNKKVWWICKKCGSSFSTSIGRRIEYKNCPYCSAKKVNQTNCLENKYPEIMKYWDYKMNNGINPSKLYYSSNKSVWWICESCGKSYQMPVWSRIKAKTNYCYDCKHQHIGNMNRIKSISEENSLFTKRPDLVKEWDIEKNLPLTSKDVTVGSGKKVWWKCSICGNEWQAVICNRTNGNGCPKCNINGSKRIK